MGVDARLFSSTDASTDAAHVYETVLMDDDDDDHTHFGRLPLGALRY